MEQNNSLNVQDMVFNREDVKVDSSLDTTSEDTSEDTTENSIQSGDEQQHGTEREVDENQIDRLEIAVRLFCLQIIAWIVWRAASRSMLFIVTVDIACVIAMACFVVKV